MVNKNHPGSNRLPGLPAPRDGMLPILPFGPLSHAIAAEYRPALEHLLVSVLPPGIIGPGTSAMGRSIRLGRSCPESGWKRRESRSRCSARPSQPSVPEPPGTRPPGSSSPYVASRCGGACAALCLLTVFSRCSLFFALILLFAIANNQETY